MKRGDRFYNLTAISDAYPAYPENPKNRNYKITVECDCGTIKEVFTNDLRESSTSPTFSCGCLKKEHYFKLKHDDRGYFIAGESHQIFPRDSC